MEKEKETGSISGLMENTTLENGRKDSRREVVYGSHSLEIVTLEHGKMASSRASEFISL